MEVRNPQTSAPSSPSDRSLHHQLPARNHQYHSRNLTTAHLLCTILAHCTASARPGLHLPAQSPQQVDPAETLLLRHCLGDAAAASVFSGILCTVYWRRGMSWLLERGGVDLAAESEPDTDSVSRRGLAWQRGPRNEDPLRQRHRHWRLLHADAHRTRWHQPGINR